MLAAHHALSLDDDLMLSRTATGSPYRDPIERHGYRTPKSSRILGGVGTIAACALVLGGLLAVLDRRDRPPVTPPPLAVLLLPPAPAKRPEPARPEPPRPRQHEAAAPKPREVAPVLPPIVPMPSPPMTVAAPQKAVGDPRPAPAVAAPAPPSPTPPALAPAPARTGPDSWEGRVLARLQDHRRYPSDARHARQQGTAVIRFRIARSGHVLSASLERSSGFAALDDAAMDTVRRSDPLPRIPPERPDEIELVVPIEFFLQR